MNHEPHLLNPSVTVSPSTSLYRTLKIKVASGAAVVSRGLRTIPAVAAWLFVVVLTRVVPEREYSWKIADDSSTSSREYASHRIISTFVSLYRRSFLYNYLHRRGYPCLFIPSCSEYAIRAVKKYGFWRGLLLTGDRFRRCDVSYRGYWIDFP